MLWRLEIVHLVARDASRATAPLRKWVSKVTHHRGKKAAMVALARKLLMIAYQVFREETVYGTRMEAESGVNEYILRGNQSSQVPLRLPFLIQLPSGDKGGGIGQWERVETEEQGSS